MRSEKQIQASRINGAKSRGPVTAIGRFNSAHPNPRRRLLAHSIVGKNESEQRFEELRSSFFEELNPATPLESVLVTKMVVAQWRQMRLWHKEKQSLDETCGEPEDTTTFEARYDRQFDRALATLQRLRAINPPDPNKSYKTDLLAIPAPPKPIPPQPAADPVFGPADVSPAKPFDPAKLAVV